VEASMNESAPKVLTFDLEKKSAPRKTRGEPSFSLEHELFKLQHDAKSYIKNFLLGTPAIDTDVANPSNMAYFANIYMGSTSQAFSC
jgi:hypothetical protein